jgi:DNA-directed RNA polymerase subunit beta'
MVFADTQEVSRAYGADQVHLQARISVRINEVAIDHMGERTESIHVVKTTVGRALLWEKVPAGISFDLIDQPMGKKSNF